MSLADGRRSRSHRRTASRTTTGPKISSRSTFIVGSVSVSTVGCDEVAAVALSASPPATALAPCVLRRSRGSRAPSRTARRRPAGPSAVSGSMPGADLDLAGVLGDALDDLVVRALLHVQPRAGGAALAMVEEDRVRRAGDRGLHVGVGEHDVRRLAAELERHLLQVAGRRLDDQLADLGRAGERHLVDVVVRGKRGAGVSPKPVTMLTTPSGSPASEDQLAQAQRRQRRLLGRLEHHRAAAGERRARASTPPSAAGSSTG